MSFQAFTKFRMETLSKNQVIVWSLYEVVIMLCSFLNVQSYVFYYYTWHPGGNW